jgi:hypothetical protein
MTQADQLYIAEWKRARASRMTAARTVSDPVARRVMVYAARLAHHHLGRHLGWASKQMAGDGYDFFFRPTP